MDGDPVASAHAAGLRHVDDSGPGLRRRRSGRISRQGNRIVPQWSIEDDHGRRVRDPATLERIRKLAIPPAWTDVWICPSAQGHLQATGRDVRGRKQYRYHPRWREERDGTKFAHLIGFGRALPALRRRIAADLRRPGLPRDKVLATVVRLLATTFIRVGNEEYARDNNSFGLTTLKDRHVTFGRSEVRFHFRGKSGVDHQASVREPTVARIVRRCRDLPGQELFQYLTEDGKRQSIDSADVNGYIREATGSDFTAKDFRTWAGTVLVAMALSRTTTGARGRPAARQVVRAIEGVAAQLRNTVAVCRRSYVHPHVIAGYLDGTLTAALPPGAAAPNGHHGTGLAPAERALLAFLRRRAAEEKKGRTLARQLRGSLRLVSSTG
jgi:DNA topoisomerase-1